MLRLGAASPLLHLSRAWGSACSIAVPHTECAAAITPGDNDVTASTSSVGTVSFSDTYVNHIFDQQPLAQSQLTPSTSAPSSHCFSHLCLVREQPYQQPYTRSYASMKYSRLVGRPAPKSWPEFEALKLPRGAVRIRWHREVLRFPVEVQAHMQDANAAGNAPRQLNLSGKAGSLVVDLEHLDPTGLVAFQFLHVPQAGSATATVSTASAESPAQSCVLLLASHDKALVKSVATQVESNIRGVSQGFLVGLTVKGVGYRLEPVEGPVLKARWYFEAAPPAPGGKGSDKATAPIAYPFPRPVHAIRLKVGYSRTAVFPLPPHVRAFFIKPTLMYLYGLRLAELQDLADRIRAVRSPNVYTGNGIQLVGEVVKLRQRKSAK